MSDLKAEVLKYVTEHPLCNATRIKEDIRRPVQEIEACLSTLKREGKVAQAMPGLWSLTKALRESLEMVPRVEPQVIPFGMKRCPGCTQVLPKAAFYASGYCKPCGKLKARENAGKRYGIRADREVRQPGKTIALRSLKRLRAAIDQEISNLEAAP